MLESDSRRRSGTGPSTAMAVTSRSRFRTLLPAFWLVFAWIPGATTLGGELVESQVTFTHSNGMSGELYFPEMTGQGGALLDYDGDGDLDAYLVQGSGLGPESMRQAPETVLARQPGDTLLRNDSTATGPTWRDVTRSSGIRAFGYGMAVATGDIDGDGRTDIFTGNYGPNQLWRNRGDGTFENASAGLAELEPRWTTSAVFLDFNRDGRDDLYVVNYVEYEVERAPVCYAPSSMRDYCGPSSFEPAPDRLLLNRDGGSYEDISARSGIAASARAGLGVAVLDTEGDGTSELYVANDGQPNFLWRREGNRWVDDALLAGVAVNRRGEPEASMGIGVADFDRDGDEDLLVTHLAGESNTLYVNSGGGLFDDRTIELSLAAPSLAKTSFGVAWVDLEHDGWLDLAIANGAVRIQPDQAAAGSSYPLDQNNQLFANRAGSFVELEASAFSAASEVSRGLIDGDVDNDGDRDLLLTNSAGPARLFLNSGADGRNWVGLSFVHPSHQSVSALYDGFSVAERASASGSYASAVDPRVVLAGEVPPRSVSITAGDKVVRLVDPPQGFYLRFE